MPNLMATGAAWLGEKLQANAGRAVTVRQGSTLLTGLTATLAMHEHEVADGEGFLTKVMAADWTFVAGDLGSTTIRAGAVITDTLSGDKYEAMPVGTRPHVERLDSLGVLLTVHTKKVA